MEAIPATAVVHVPPDVPDVVTVIEAPWQTDEGTAMVPAEGVDKTETVANALSEPQNAVVTA
jgi:hypothetical protein